MTKLLTTLRYIPSGSIKDSIYLYDMHLQRLSDGINALSPTSNSADFKEETLTNEVTRAINAAEGTEVPHRVSFFYILVCKNAHLISQVSVRLEIVDLSINATAARLTNMPDCG